MKKVGLITIQRWWNYGSMLQAYAEFKKLNLMGYDCEFIDFMPAKLFNTRSFRMYNDVSEYAGIRDRYIEAMGGRKARFRDFEKLYRISRNTYGCDKDLEDNPPQYDVYITGGDQIWNVNMRIASKAFFLHFTDSKEKYAFSTSVGRCTEEKLSLYLEEIKKYKKIFMREKSGSDKIRSLLGDNSDVEVGTMVDPTLQLSSKQWLEIIPEEPLYEKPYLLCYATLDDELRNMFPMLKEMHGFLGIKVVLFGMVVPIEEDWIINKVDAGPFEFLRLIRDAEYVLTQSFHGTVFSCMFHKTFFTFNIELNEPRKNEILNNLGLSNRIVSKDRKLEASIFERPNFDSADRFLRSERERAERSIISCLGECYGI